jgi:hypothetical protein
LFFFWDESLIFITKLPCVEINAHHQANHFFIVTIGSQQEIQSNLIDS